MSTYYLEANGPESSDVVVKDRMTIHPTHVMDVDENPGGGYYWVCDSCGLTAAVGDPSSNWKLGDHCSPTPKESP